MVMLSKNTHETLFMLWPGLLIKGNWWGLEWEDSENQRACKIHRLTGCFEVPPSAQRITAFLQLQSINKVLHLKALGRCVVRKKWDQTSLFFVIQKCYRNCKSERIWIIYDDCPSIASPLGATCVHSGRGWCLLLGPMS